MMSLGTFGKKIGMSQIFDDDGRVIPVTVVRVDPCPIVQVKTPAEDGYSAIQLGFGELKNAKRVNRPAAGHFKRAGLPTDRRHLKEIRLADLKDHQVGQMIGLEIFEPGERVVVRGISKGRGFTGVMKRHGFHGYDAGHGTHEYFRHGGSIGSNTWPARIWKGKKMAGHHGNSQITVRNLQIVRVDRDRNLLLLRGAVPGPAGGYIRILKKS